MATSLAEQLKRLQTPQSSQFVDTKKRDSILFTSKEAATKSREIIFEIGLSGLQELIEMNPIFEDFQSTLFDSTAKDMQRAVESKKVNALLDKNIRRFMFHLSPYFMIPASHKCLEWLIRRFSINLYNQEDFLALILPYHQTNMFVRCVQTLKFEDSSSKWDFLAEIKKSSSPLSKLTLWNHGASQPSFLGFVGKFTHEAIKELEHKAGSLQTMVAFYCTTLIGAMEQAQVINDNHILNIAKFLVKAYKSTVSDFTAAGYMITAQLLVKSKLRGALLGELMDKITKTPHPQLSQDLVLLLCLMFQVQSDELKLTDKALDNIMTFRWLPSAFEQMTREGKPFIGFYRALVCKLLEKIADKSGEFLVFKEYFEQLMGEVVLEDGDAMVIIRAMLDSYIQSPDEDSNDSEDSKMKSNENESNGIISLDSDDEDENIPLKSEDITIWYSKFLKTFERRYPVAFDQVVKDVMTTTPGRKRNGLKNVLGFLLQVSCASYDTNIFENLYHHNATIRTEAVTYLVQNLSKITLSADGDTNNDIMKITITERLSDENPKVFSEMLNIESDKLVELIGADEVVAKLTNALMRYWKSPEKWNSAFTRVLSVLTSDGVYQKCSDPNILLISVLPFLFSSGSGEMSGAQMAYRTLKDSKYGKSLEFTKKLPKTVQDPEKVLEILEKSKKFPSSESVLATIKSLLVENQKTGGVSIHYAFLLLALSIESRKSSDFCLDVIRTVKEILEKRKIQLVNKEVTDTTSVAQEVPVQVVTLLLKNLISSTTFDGPAVNFTESSLKLEVFEFLVEKFFTSPDQSQRQLFNEVIKTLLDASCDSDHLTKLEFFSQFCVAHTVYGTSIDLQIRAIRLLNHILTSNQEFSRNYSDRFFQNILVSLSSDTSIIREFGVELITTLHSQNIPTHWKFLLEKLVERKSEILMDSEQLSLILYLLTSKKTVKPCVDSIIAAVEATETLDYLRSSLLMIVKHLTEKKLLDVMAKVASVGISDEIQRFEESQSQIVKLVLMKINSTTVGSFWNLASSSLTCHRLLSDDEGKFLTPSILVLKAIDDDLLAKLHPDHRLEVFKKIVTCSMSEQSRIVQAAQKTFQTITVDCKVVKTFLQAMPRLRQMNSKKTLENPLKSGEWKFGVTLLELLQNKSKGLVNPMELIPALFDVLGSCLQAPDDTNVEYERQIILSLLLTTCQSAQGKIPEAQLKSELVVKCIKESENPQTHHHALLLLAQLALMTPDQVLNDMLAIFTFVGTTLVRQEDSYSFQIIAKIIENIVPTLAQAKRGSNEVIPILKIFASVILQVPDHRRLMLYVKLLSTLDVNQYLWIFIGLALESQVMSHTKGKAQDDLPARVQVALAITKEFDMKVIVETATSLIKYLRDLPMFLEKKPADSVDLDQNTIFSVKTHSDFQLRHFKYLVLLYLKNLMTSPEVHKKASQLTYNSRMELKGQFQELILTSLTCISEISKSMDHPRIKAQEKSWQSILHSAFDILEAAIEILTPEMLLVVVANIMSHELLLIRKKVIELFNRKLEENYFDAVDDEKLLQIMVALKKNCDSVGEADVSTAMEMVQQSALMSIKLLARKLADDHPEDFVEILEQLTEVMERDEIKSPVMMNLVICIAELTAVLKVRAIGMLGRFMPNVLKLVTLGDDDPVSFLLLYSSTSALLRIIETVPLFLSPYLVSIISQLTRVAPGLKLLNDTKITAVLGKINKIWINLSQLVPSRILIPAIEEVYEKVMQKSSYNCVESLMDLIFEMFQQIPSKDIKGYQAELTEFFLKSLNFRCVVGDKLKIQEIDEIEQHIIKSLVALVLKLSEGSFRPLFESISTWAFRDDPDNFLRSITFFRLTTEISGSLKSLFLLFASDLVEVAGSLLEKCNPSSEEHVSFPHSLCLTKHILQTLYNIFLHDHQNFVNSHRFDIVMQPIVNQIENEAVLESDEMQLLVRSCVAQLAVAASDDILWKQLNYQVLMKTRSDSSEQRIFGVKVCVDMAKKLGEDFEPLVPETIPFLSELLEDEDYQVVEACQNGVRELESTVGESLQKYL